MSHGDSAAVRTQFNRRFAFGLHAVSAGIVSFILFVLSLTHPLNMAVWNGQSVWAGYARPDLMYLGSFLVSGIAFHGLWLLGREGRINRRRMILALHTLLSGLGVGLVITYLTSWYFDEMYKWADYYVPVSPGSPPTAVVYSVLALTLFSLLALIPHGIGPNAKAF
jgi:hypothetical protein